MDKKFLHAIRINAINYSYIVINICFTLLNGPNRKCKVKESYDVNNEFYVQFIYEYALGTGEILECFWFLSQRTFKDGSDKISLAQKQ